ncbi:hypothetical protein ILUMI_09365 [Ignelater luminosus]|uniref:Carboxylic ester hydrolase n=1 Tax=Ignelater luminosus TaxID=2038154 RepID=A0A8K0GF43_IGNLU|nr:hypothetical protein ILUMI_09365 [Ignelater luminosus]
MASPGNYGLKDQVTALKWIKRNIHHFGGNPLQVTIFGESSGGAAVHYLLQTPHTSGLFHRAISESGASLCNWAFQKNPKKVAFKIGAAVDVLTNNTNELISQLRKLDKDTLLSAALDVLLQCTYFTFFRNPTPLPDESLDYISWPTVDSSKGNSELKFLDINSTLTVNVNPRQDAMEFWDQLYEEYGRPPYDTY